MVDEGSTDEGGMDEGSGERTSRGRATKASSTRPPRVSPCLRKPLWVAFVGAGVSSATSGGLLIGWGRLAVGRWLGSFGRLPALGMALSALEGFVSFDGNETVAMRTSLPAMTMLFGGTCGGAASGRCRPSKKSSRATRARAMMAAAVEAATASSSKSAAAACAGTGAHDENRQGAVVGDRAHPPKVNLAASTCANVMGAGAPKVNATGPPKVAEYAGVACHTA